MLHPMEFAPTDGTLIIIWLAPDQYLSDALTGGEGEMTWTIGFNISEKNTGWRFVGWNSKDSVFTEGQGTPIGWEYLPKHLYEE